MLINSLSVGSMQLYYAVREMDGAQKSARVGSVVVAV